MATLDIPTTRDFIEYRQTSKLDGRVFVFLFKRNVRDNSWVFDLFEEDGTPIRHGVKLVTGFPLLERVVLNTRPDGEFYVVDTTGADLEPDQDNLGGDVSLTYDEGA